MKKLLNTYDVVALIVILFLIVLSCARGALAIYRSEDGAGIVFSPCCYSCEHRFLPFSGRLQG